MPQAFVRHWMMALITFLCSLGMEAPKDAIYSGPKVRKISLIEYTVKSFHGMLYDFVSIFCSFISELEVTHGGFKLAVTHVALNKSGVGPGFQQVSGIAVAQGMDGNMTFFYSGSILCLSKGSLDAPY
jgi:hypothetical protein